MISDSPYWTHWCFLFSRKIVFLRSIAELGVCDIVRVPGRHSIRPVVSVLVYSSGGAIDNCTEEMKYTKKELLISMCVSMYMYEGFFLQLQH